MYSRKLTDKKDSKKKGDKKCVFLSCLRIVVRKKRAQNSKPYKNVFFGYIQYNSESVYIKIWDPKDETV